MSNIQHHRMTREAFEELERLHSFIEAAQENFREAVQRTREAEAPCAPGEIVTITDWSYQGKQMLVDKVALVRNYKGSYGWKVWGHVLNADGKPGQRIGETSFMTTREDLDE